MRLMISCSRQPFDPANTDITESSLTTLRSECMTQDEIEAISSLPENDEHGLPNPRPEQRRSLATYRGEPHAPSSSARSAFAYEQHEDRHDAPFPSSIPFIRRRVLAPWMIVQYSTVIAPIAHMRTFYLWGRVHRSARPHPQIVILRARDRNTPPRPCHASRSTPRQCNMSFNEVRPLTGAAAPRVSMPKCAYRCAGDVLGCGLCEKGM